MDNNDKISALILAAGEGRRFGFPKWQAVYNGITFLEIIRDVLHEAGINNIKCVYRENSKPGISGLNYVRNVNAENGMFSSIYYGSRLLDQTNGVIIWPVDHPFIRKETVVNLINCFDINKQSVVKPVYSGTGGHPVILPFRIFEKIKTDNYEGGLRKLIINSGINVVRLPVEDKNILRNVNTLNEYL